MRIYRGQKLVVIVDQALREIPRFSFKQGASQSDRTDQDCRRQTERLTWPEHRAQAIYEYQSVGHHARGSISAGGCREEIAAVTIGAGRSCLRQAGLAGLSYNDRVGSCQNRVATDDRQDLSPQPICAELSLCAAASFSNPYAPRSLSAVCCAHPSKHVRSCSALFTTQCELRWVGLQSCPEPASSTAETCDSRSGPRFASTAPLWPAVHPCRNRHHQ